jgi:ESX secretion system protein EccD
MSPGRGVISPAAAGDICRITVVGPRRRVDIALPSHVPFADLFPAIAGFSRLDAAEAARAPGGWVLQRLGQRPFEPSATPAGAGLLDGELIYLRPRVAELPEMVSDDIADEIAAVHGGSQRWAAADTRRVTLGAGAAALAAGALVIARAGAPVALSAAVAGAMALILLVAAACAARVIGDTAAGLVLGCTALPYAFLAGLFLAALGAREQAAPHPGALGMLAGFAVALFGAVVAAATVNLPAFLGPVIAALSGLAAAWLACQSTRLGAAGAAALVVTVVLALMPLIPAAALRLARLPLPAIPASAEDLRDDALLAPLDGVRDRAAAADRIVAGTVCGVGLTGAGVEVALGLGHGVLPTVMAAVLACVLLLRSRVFPGRPQRLWLIIPGYGGLVLLGATAGRLSAVLALAAGAALVIGAGSWLPGHRPSPFWGRAADVADTLLIVSLIPLALGVAGILSYLHGLGG